MAKLIVITGAGSGLGRALARKFVADRDKVFLLGRTLAKLEKVVEELGKYAIPIVCDIGKPGSVRTAFASIAERHSKIDVLINNAAMIDFSTLAEASDDHILEMVATNLTGNLLCSRAAIAMMERGGHIINVSSGGVEAHDPHLVTYKATKGGVEVLSRHLQEELLPRGIRVSLVRAGPMYGEDYSIQASPEAMQAFRQECVERGIDFSKAGITHFDSVLWVFRSLVDMPADMHIDTVRITSRRA
jgi:meso-butanediol dehydrogenase / (S,S)-butanediol dehydrogenase / diacetyl reductase